MWYNISFAHCIINIFLLSYLCCLLFFLLKYILNLLYCYTVCKKKIQCRLKIGLHSNVCPIALIAKNKAINKIVKLINGVIENTLHCKAPWVIHHEAGKHIDLAVLDFSKAFDTVPHLSGKPYSTGWL